MTGTDVVAGAQGKFAIFVASMLQRAGVAPMAEFASLLGAFAESVAETEAEEGAILTAWADRIAEVASS